jgi:hypothetical protein
MRENEIELSFADFDNGPERPPLEFGNGRRNFRINHREGWASF